MHTYIHKEIVSNVFVCAKKNIDVGSSSERKEVKDKVAFRTLSQIEILDDGYKWRKYGKKMVKNSPNPR